MEPQKHHLTALRMLQEIVKGEKYLRFGHNAMNRATHSLIYAARMWLFVIE
jgi:hypothetical protein